MSPFNKRLIILLASLIVLVAMIGYSMRDNGGTLLPEQFVKDTVGWVQSAFYQPAHFVAGLFKNIESLKKVYEQNRILRSRLDQYAELSEEVKRLKNRNEELEGLLGKKNSPELSDYTVRQARVIARAPDNWNKQVTINKGKKDGIEVNMAVITAEGMVGKIRKVSPFFSTVQLVSDLGQTNLISAVIQEENEKDIYGMIEGYDPKKKALQFKLIPYDAKLKKGQHVITSGLGGVLPSGLILGTVTEFTTDPQGLTKTAYVKPSANLNEFYNVMVVERNATQVDKTNESKGAAS